MQKQRRCIEGMKAIVDKMIKNIKSQFTFDDFNKIDQLIKMLESAHAFAKEQQEMKDQSILSKRRAANA